MYEELDADDPEGLEGVVGENDERERDTESRQVASNRTTYESSVNGSGGYRNGAAASLTSAANGVLAPGESPCPCEDGNRLVFLLRVDCVAPGVEQREA